MMAKSLAATEEEVQTASVVVPTYNERENVVHVVERCRSALSEIDPEILVVDDDSPDGTWWYARDRFRGEEQVHIIRRTDERGLATAVIRGFREASEPICAVLDADLQHPPAVLQELCRECADGADIVIGSRYVPGGGIENWSWFRRAVSIGATSIAKLCVPAARGIADPLSGFFVVQREIVEDVDLDPVGYKVLLEILAKCEYDTVEELPYVFTERESGDSNLTPDEYLNFLEHVLELILFSHGLDRFIPVRRAIRAIECGLIGGVRVPRARSRSPARPPADQRREVVVPLRVGVPVPAGLLPVIDLQSDPKFLN